MGVTVLTFPTFHSTSVLGGGGGCINIPNVPQYFCIGGGGAVLTFPTFLSTSGPMCGSRQRVSQPPTPPTDKFIVWVSNFSI